MRVAGIASVLGVAAAGGAALGLIQVGVAELADITTLGGDFGGGEDRVQGVQITLVAWYCALAVPLAVWLASLRRETGRAERAAAVLAAGLGTFAAVPLVSWLSGSYARDDATSAVLTGVLLGLVGGAAVALRPSIGRGLVAYAGLLWLVALGCTLLVDPTVVYAGMVEPLGLDFLDELSSVLPSTPSDIAYHLPTMLPVAVMVLVLTGVLAGRTARRTAWGESVALAVTGPVLAAAAYRVTPGQGYLWNDAAGTIVLALTACCLVVAAAVAGLCRHGAIR